MDGGWLGEIYHFHGQAYSPVVVNPKQDTWRSKPEDGGGCLMDYASRYRSINHIIAPVSGKASMLKSIFSKTLMMLSCQLELSNQVTGLLTVNWSDDTIRKMRPPLQSMQKRSWFQMPMSSRFILRMIARKDILKLNIKHVTDLTQEVTYYRGRIQYAVDYFSRQFMEVPNNINHFESAWLTDGTISLIEKNTL